MTKQQERRTPCGAALAPPPILLPEVARSPLIVTTSYLVCPHAMML